MPFLAVAITAGCRLGGDFGSDTAVSAVDGNSVLSGKVALANDVDTGLLASVLNAAASGAVLGQTIPFSGLKAQAFFYTQGATAAVTLPVEVSASGTFVLPVSSRNSLYNRGNLVIYSPN